MFIVSEITSEIRLVYLFRGLRLYITLILTSTMNELHQCTNGRDHTAFVGFFVASTKNNIVKIYIDSLSTSSLLSTLNVLHNKTQYTLYLRESWTLDKSSKPRHFYADDTTIIVRRTVEE